MTKKDDVKESQHKEAKLIKKEINWKLIAIASFFFIAVLSAALVVSVLSGVKNCRLNAISKPIDSIPEAQVCPLPSMTEDNPLPAPENSVQEIPILKEFSDKNSVLIGKDEYVKAQELIARDYYAVSTNFKRLKIGDNFVFGFAAKNMDYKSHRFRPSITVDRVEVVEGNLANKAPYEEDTLKSWIASSFFNEFNLGPNEYTIIPLSIKVDREKAPDDPTIAAGYYFTLKMEVYNDKAEKWEEYHDTAKKTLYIRVE